MALLEVENCTIRFDGLLANDSVTLTMNAGEIVGLIGPNGAGKTTLFNGVAGAIPLTAGCVRFAGAVISGLKPHAICKRGVARTFQIVKMLKTMTVRENVLVGAFNRTADMHAAGKIADTMLQRFDLWPKRDWLSHQLTIAQMKRLEIARAMATQPRLLLLDEVMAGLNPSETQEAIRLIQGLHADGMTLLIVEHVMEAMMSLCQRVVVLDAGKKIMEGTPNAVVRDERVIAAYLGDRYHAPH